MHSAEPQGNYHLNYLQVPWDSQSPVSCIIGKCEVTGKIVTVA